MKLVVEVVSSILISPLMPVEKDCRIFLRQIIFLYEEKKMDKNLLPEI